MRAIAQNKQPMKGKMAKGRLEQEKSLSYRQVFMRRLFHRMEARVETLPPFLMTSLSVGLIGAFSIYGFMIGGQGLKVSSDVTSALGFGVQSVVISGQESLDERDILDILGLTSGASLMTFNVDQAQKTLLREPWIKSVSIRKIYPGKLHIKLAERQSFAIWQRGRIVSVIDENGLVLDHFNETRHNDLPILVGHGAQRQGAEFMSLLQKFPTIASRVRASMLHSERRWDILLDNKVTVKLPESNMAEALLKLSELDHEKDILSKDLVSIDMRLPDRLVMRLSDEAMVNRLATIKRQREERSKGKKI